MSFARSLQGGDVVALFGDLGTGKTCFITGVAAGLGVAGHVASPTFTMIHEYPAAEWTVVHIDLYRITSVAELAELGIEEYFREQCICLIEWAERMMGHLPASAIRVKLAYGKGDNDRLITIEQARDNVAAGGGEGYAGPGH